MVALIRDLDEYRRVVPEIAELQDEKKDVAPVNKAQTELLHEEMSIRMAKTPEAERYRLRWEATLET